MSNSRTIFSLLLLSLGATSPVQAQLAAWSEVPANLPSPSASNAAITVHPAGVNGITFYDDLAIFEGEAPGLPVEDFSGTLVPPNDVNVCTPPLTSATDDLCFPAGGVLPGFELDVFVNGGGGDYVVLTTGFLGLPFNVVGPNSFADDLDLTFNPPVTAVAMDIIGDIATPVDVDVDIFGPGDVLLDSTTAIGVMAGTFLGITADGSPIERIEITDINDGGELIGNLRFGEVLADPIFGAIPNGIGMFAIFCSDTDGPDSIASGLEDLWPGFPVNAAACSMVGAP